jgi:hypothetical protein
MKIVAILRVREGHRGIGYGRANSSVIARSHAAYRGG